MATPLKIVDSPPQVSVVMPVYNGERYVLSSVNSILQQSVADFEFIIVDDGSTDGSLDEIKRCAEADGRIHVISQPNRGVTNALNAGLRVARGRFIARMDCGDLSLPERFERQVEYLTSHTECSVVGTYFDIIDCDGDIVCTRRPSLLHEELEAGFLGQVQNVGGICHAGAMIRTKPLVDLGGYSEEFQFAQDRDLWLRLAEHGRLANIPEVHFQVRIIPGQGISSARVVDQRACAIRAIRNAYARRGLADPTSLNLWRIVTDPHDQLYGIVKAALASGQYRTARKHVAVVLRQLPFRLQSWKLAVRAALGRADGAIARFRQRVRRTRG